MDLKMINTAYISRCNCSFFSLNSLRIMWIFQNSLIMALFSSSNTNHSSSPLGSPRFILYRRLYEKSGERAKNFSSHRNGLKKIPPIPLPPPILLLLYMPLPAVIKWRYWLIVELLHLSASVFTANCVSENALISLTMRCGIARNLSFATSLYGSRYILQWILVLRLTCAYSLMSPETYNFTGNVHVSMHIAFTR